MAAAEVPFFRLSWKRIFLTSLFYLTSGELFCKSNELEVKNSPVVDTTLGTIIGSTVKVKDINVHQFLSVPYAKAPIDDLRFKKPESVEPWSEPLLATREPPACIQYTENPFPWYDDEPGKNEDCLFLNIWTPSNATPKSPKAVLYWIFGGGFFIGSTRSRFYSGEALAAVGDIIVVTVNYRLGSLGFLYSGSSDAPGNMGIWDILAGLQWVNDHISAFGGDVSRITLAGESAGSIAVGLLAVSPLAKDLYTGLIMMSGSPAYTVADDNTLNMARSQRIAELVSCASETFTLKDNPEEVVRCLKGVDAMDLSKAEFSLIPHSSRSFLPQYGDDILPENPRKAIISHNFHNKDVLIGNVKDEGSFQITTSNPDLFGFFGEKDPQISKTAGENMLRKLFAAFPGVGELLKQYLPDSIQEDDYETVRSQIYTASGDFSLICPTVYFAEKYAESGNKVYYYLWSHRPNVTPWASWMGVPHFSEVQFAFGLPVIDHHQYTNQEVDLSIDIIKELSNFVKNGEPTKQWPLYSKDNPTFLYLDVKTEGTGIGPHKDNCDFFRPYFGF